MSKWIKPEDFSDNQLIRMKAPIDAITKRLREWSKSTYKGYGMIPMTAFNRANCRETVRSGLWWVRQLKRAIKIGEAHAAANCMFEVANILSELHYYFNEVSEHNSLVPAVRKSESRKKQSNKANRQSADTRKKKADDDVIKIQRFAKKYRGNSLKFIYAQIEDSLGFSERKAREALKPIRHLFK